MTGNVNYKVDLFEPNLSGRTFEYDLDDSFFKEIDGLLQRGNIHTVVDCLCMGSSFRFTIHSVGTVIVPCDRCLADLELRIETEDELSVRLGAEYDDDGECVTVPETEGYIDLAPFIYEFIALSMPITSTHEPGKCDETMMQELSMHQAARSGQEDDEYSDDSPADAPVDERWAKLKELL